MAEARQRQSSPLQSPLEGQVAVVTGASRGIGEAVARLLASMGARVVLTARNQTRLQQVKAAIEKSSGSAVIVACDLTDSQAIAALGSQVRKEFKRCDILVNNAGIGIMGKPLVEFPLEDWDRMIDTNLRAPYLMIRALAPMMMAAKSGHIINISSLAGRNPLANGAAYSASKWGLNGLTYSVAEELRLYNVRVTVIAPGSVNTEFDGDSAGPGGRRKDPLKMIQPEDVARVVASLVTEAPNSFTSEVLMRPTVKP